MRTLEEVERDIARVTRKIDIDAEIQRFRWAITQALKTDGDLDECERSLDRLEKLIAEMRA